MALDDLLKRMTDGSGLQAEFHLEGDEPAMPAEWEESLLRVAQESLTNTIKHEKAKNFRATLAIAANEIQFRRGYLSRDARRRKIISPQGREA